MASKTLAQALLSVQQKLDAVEKTGYNPHFKSNFADLTAVIDVVKPALNAEGILFLQIPVPARFENYLALETSLILVETGEVYKGVAETPLTKADPQGYGSAITYLRRYSLISILGLKTVDDDGNAASNTTVARPSQNAGPLRPLARPQSATPTSKEASPSSPAVTSGKSRLFPKVAGTNATT